MNGAGHGEPNAVAAIWIGLAFASALISTRTSIAVSLIEILVGVVVGNAFHLPTTSWIDFLDGFGSGLLTFLAGAEIEPQVIARHWKQNVTDLGTVAALGFLFAHFNCYLLAFVVANGIVLPIASRPKGYPPRRWCRND